MIKIVSEYDQEIPPAKTADKPKPFTILIKILVDSLNDCKHRKQQSPGWCLHCFSVF